MVAKSKNKPLTKKSQAEPAVQALSIRLPVDMYKQLREAAFKNNEKMNVIIVGLVKQYLSTVKTNK